MMFEQNLLTSLSYQTNNIYNKGSVWWWINDERQNKAKGIHSNIFPAVSNNLMCYLGKNSRERPRIKPKWLPRSVRRDLQCVSPHCEHVFFFQLIPVLPLVDKASRWVDASSGKDGGVTRFGSFWEEYPLDSDWVCHPAKQSKFVWLACALFISL